MDKTIKRIIRMKNNTIIQLFFGVLTMLFLNSCVSKNEQSLDSQTFDEEIGTISKFEFEGHTYLIRNANPYLGYQGYGGLCHDENCKCKKPVKRECLNVEEDEW